MSTFSDAMETAANYLLMNAGIEHRQCEHAFREHAPRFACDECLQQCAHCGELCLFQGGRDESISGAIFCRQCSNFCQACLRPIDGKMFAAEVEEYDQPRQIVPTCKACELRYDVDCGEQEAAA